MERDPIDEGASRVVSDRAAREKATVDVRANDQGERLLDRAMEETFPASDAIMPAIKPG